MKVKRRIKGIPRLFLWACLILFMFVSVVTQEAARLFIMLFLALLTALLLYWKDKRGADHV